MIARFASWWRLRTAREQALLAAMLALVGATFAWFGVLVPLDHARAAARRDLALAAERNASVRAKVALLRRPEQPVPVPAADVATLATQAATGVGLTLDSSQMQGPGRLAVVAAPASSAAVLGWVAAIEAQGLVIETIAIRTAPTGGVLTATATVREPAR